MTTLTGHPTRACRDADPRGFTLGDEERFLDAEMRLQDHAVRFCGDCPLRAACEAQGPGQWGVWGGVMFRPGCKPINLLDPRSTPQYARRHQRIREAS